MPPEAMGKVLVIFAHPAFHRSRTNRVLVEAARSAEGVTVHDLYETYPDFLIDARAEQRLLEEHDAVVLQHPFFWYSSPALVKEWLDLVLQYGWAYGEKGDALRGKVMAQAITAGGPEDAYQREGTNHFSVRELLSPFEQTARLCGMAYAEAFTVHAANHIGDPDRTAAGERYVEWLTAIRDGSASLWLPGPG
ncbi:NAD(P)H-dependent oxidoreductase [Luteolibacter ambystomatis]|uniref:NAD(P)H-dependent oxidoreductase n=1 Tax=Luteolibacter ambystomatis TaxID=2824561 RepID=A0A975IYZ5_9BACT|nr:NAD(P)H-dependent oxidoreductase [Luteolibacter ambystomatis]QUE50398.1 NAD(P)H-dependent oxidoreductase [Luteolibacter ambystomatis]